MKVAHYQVAGRWHRNETLPADSETKDSLGSPLGLENPAFQFGFGHERKTRSGAASADRYFSARLSPLKASETTSVSTTTAFMQPDQSQYVPAISRSAARKSSMFSSSGQKSPNSSRGSELGIVFCASFNSSIEGCPADAYFCSIVCAIGLVYIR